MARTPFVDVLRRAAAIAAHARRTGQPLDEVVAVEREMRVDHARRKFLRDSAGASAALALAACAPVPFKPAPDDNEVVIVGAGVAGLTCAYRLRQAGTRVRVFEAQERIGGRMFSLTNHFADGQVCELGGELIDTGHARIRALAAELGLALDDLSQDPTAAAGDIWFANGRRYSEHDILVAFAPLAAAIARDAETIPDEEITYATPGGVEALDRESMTQWLDRNGASGWLRKLIEVAYTTEMGLECSEQSALNFLTFIDPGTESFKIFGESDEAWRIEGGSSKLIKALVDALTKNKIKMNQSYTLTGIENENGRIALSFDAPGGAQHHTFDAVILALPFTCLRKVEGLERLPLSPEKLKCIRELGMGKNAKIMVGTKSRVWRSPVSDLPVLSNGNICSDLGFQDFWETSRRQKPSEAGILTVFLGGDAALPDKKYTFDAFRADLAKMSPKMAESLDPTAVLPFFWSSYRYTLGSYSGAQVGQYTTMYTEARKAAFDGRLQFAGEHTEGPDNNGYMNGGVKSGNRAAQNLLKIMGLPYALPHAKSCPHRLSSAC